MDVILSEEVDNLGNAGDVVNVKPGYARNFLLPRGLAVRADQRNVKAFEHQKRALEARRTKLEEVAREAAKGVDSAGLGMLSREFFERAFESGEECLVGCFIRPFLAGGRHLARA